MLCTVNMLNLLSYTLSLNSMCSTELHSKMSSTWLVCVCEACSCQVRGTWRWWGQILFSLCHLTLRKRQGQLYIWHCHHQTMLERCNHFTCQQRNLLEIFIPVWAHSVCMLWCVRVCRCVCVPVCMCGKGGVVVGDESWTTFQLPRISWWTSWAPPQRIADRLFVILSRCGSSMCLSLSMHLLQLTSGGQCPFYVRSVTQLRHNRSRGGCFQQLVLLVERWVSVSVLEGAENVKIRLGGGEV